MRKGFTLVELITPLRPALRGSAGRGIFREKQRRSGFTLVELIIVIAIIVIIAAVMLLAIDPFRRLSGANDARRQRNANQFTAALNQHLVDRERMPGDKTIPAGEANAIAICRLRSSGADCVNLDDILPTYLSCIPFDSAETTAGFSGYKVFQFGGSLSVVSAHIGEAAGGGCEKPGAYPIAYWKFDESSIGAQARNAMADQFHATPQNFASPQGPTVNVPTVHFQNLYSLDFDGFGDHLRVTTSSLLDLNRTFTVTAWVFMDIATTWDFDILMRSDGTGSNEFGFGAESDDKYGTHISDYGHESNSNTPVGAWTHLAIVRDNTAVRFYLNGIADGTSTSNVDTDYGTCTTLFIGTDVDSLCTGGLGDYWDGKLDEVRVYNAALPASQIQALANGYLW